MGPAMFQCVCACRAKGHQVHVLTPLASVPRVRAVTVLWNRAALADDPPARVGLVLENLRDPDAPTLFEHDARDRRIQWMIDRVRERYGAPALLWGECADPHGPYTGAKIAYQSFPDTDRLHWLGLVGGNEDSAYNARGGGLHRASLGSTARTNSRA